LEVSTLRYSRGIGLHGRLPLLRLQSDERLIAYVRKGNHAAFEVLVSRYQSRLLSFCRHLLGSREDAEDVLQEVLAAAFNAILADDRPINVRPWLYRIARNRSLNHLRRIQAVGVDSMDIHLSDNGATTADKVHEREEFRVLVDDIHELPETQRTALVLREMDALSYEQIAEAMETTVSSVKSLLVRARVSLAEAAEARLLSCDEVRIELGEVAEGLRRRPTPLVRRHLRTCKRCSSFKTQLRETNKALTALLPIGPLVLLRKAALVHLGHSAAGGSSATGAGAAGQAAAVGTTTAAAGAAAGIGSTGGILSAGIGAIATKAAAGLAAAALVTAGAVEVSQKPAPSKLAATHHHPVITQAPPPPPPRPAAPSSSGSFKSTVAPVHEKKTDAVKKASATKSSDAAQSSTKTVDKTQGKDGTATTKAAAPTEPPGRSQTETDPTVLPPPAVPAPTTTPAATATTPPAPTTTTTTTTPTTPTSTTPTTTTPTSTTPTTTTPTSTTPTTTTPPTTTVGPPADGTGTSDGSTQVGVTGDPAQLGDPSATASLDTLTAVTRQHRHRHHHLLTW
jgi:RNA polymerase sigma factor (sigma-70 family)